MTDHEKMACELLADEYDREGMTGEAACVRDGYTGSLDEDCALRAITAAYNKGRADMREEAAEIARNRHEEWGMPHPDDAKPGEVCDDISACRDIAAAIRAIPVESE